MTAKLQGWLQSKGLLIGLATVTAALLIAAAPQAGAATTNDAAAAAIKCRVYDAKTGFYAGGRVASQVAYVPKPPTSYCKDINVRNIQAVRHADGKVIKGDTCATFRVVMYPSNGKEPIYTKAKHICSTGPNGPVVPVATDVINGTKYRVIYDVENQDWRHDYQIVD